MLVWIWCSDVKLKQSTAFLTQKKMLSTSITANDKQTVVRFFVIAVLVRKVDQNSKALKSYCFEKKNGICLWLRSIKCWTLWGTRCKTNTNHGFIRRFDWLVKPIAIPWLFLIGSAISHHFIEPMREQSNRAITLDSHLKIVLFLIFLLLYSIAVDKRHVKNQTQGA